MYQDLIRLLENIATSLEESNDIFNSIANHYDGVVPVMTRHAKRVEKAHVETENNGSLLDIFRGVPREQEN